MKKKFNRIVITSGPTREWLDPVRFISNPSSGQTGYQLAIAAKKNYGNLFEEIILISGPGDSRYRNVPGIVNITVESTLDMQRATEASIDNNTILFMAAAPADFTPIETKNQKMKKSTESNDSAFSRAIDKENKEKDISEISGIINVAFKPTSDILLSIKDVKYSNFLKIGFAAETEKIEEYAKGKLVTKNLDYIVANYVNKDQIGFGSSDNSYYIFGKDGSEFKLAPAPKSDLSAMLLDLIIKIEADREF
jgi:phosphopantothenoylcysteine decarboxylase/phosphopantothenate--cysteine ligase